MFNWFEQYSESVTWNLTSLNMFFFAPATIFYFIWQVCFCCATIFLLLRWMTMIRITCPLSFNTTSLKWKLDWKICLNRASNSCIFHPIWCLMQNNFIKRIFGYDFWQSLIICLLLRSSSCRFKHDHLNWEIVKNILC